MPSSTDVLIPLKHGFAVPESVLTWLLSTEDRGVTFAVVNGRLRVSPATAVSDDDDHFIREHAELLKACVAYCAEMAREPL